MKRVACLIPVYNSAEGLKKSLDSLEGLNSEFDVVVVDDGSEPAIDFDRSRYSFDIQLARLNQNQGIEGALNEGLRLIQQAGYEFIARLDAGDCMVPGRIDKQIEFLDAEPNCGVVGTWVEMVDGDDQPLYRLMHPTTHEGILQKHRFNTGIAHPSVMMRTSLIPQVGLYSSKYKAAEDFDLWLRIQKIAELRNIDECLVRKEISTASISAKQHERQTFSRLRLLCREFAWMEPRSYAGLVHCAASFLFSYSTVAYLRQKWQPRRPSRA